MYIIVHEGRRLAICGADRFDRLKDSPIGAELIRVRDGKLVATSDTYNPFNMALASLPAGRARTRPLLRITAQPTTEA